MQKTRAKGRADRVRGGRAAAKGKAPISAARSLLTYAEEREAEKMVTRSGAIEELLAEARKRGSKP